MSSSGDITLLLRRLSNGDNSAEKDLIPLVYAQLRRIAGNHLRKERSAYSLEATALVHEAYIRMTGTENVAWKDRLHFYAVASRAMRRVLIDRARSKHAIKRGENVHHLALDQTFELTDETFKTVERLNDALERLSTLDPRQAQIVEMRFFGGLTENEISVVLNVSSRTIRREWTAARAWLYGEIEP